MRTRTPLKRKTPLSGGGAPKRGGKPARKRRGIKPKKRSAKEFARIYGSAERVEWIKAQPSVVGAERPCVNAHVRNGGMGRKADAKWIVPMTDEEHRLLHGIGKIPFEAIYTLDLDEEARKTEQRWQAHINGQPQ